MTAKVLPFKQPSIWEPVLDGKGRKVPTLIRHRPSQIIHIQKTFKKYGIPRLQVTTGETTLGKAKSTAQMLVQQHVNKYLNVDDSHAILKTGGRNFGSVADEVLREHTPTKRKGTQENHEYYIGVLKKEFGSFDVNAINLPLFNERIRKLRKQMKRQTFADFAKNMNLVMRYAYKHKYCTHLVSFPNPDKKEGEEQETTGRRYTDEELSALWKVMNEETRDQFVLSYECFMRLREALHLTWDRVDLRTGQITLRAIDVKTGSKTGKGRTFIASPQALTRLRKRYANRIQSRYVFPSPVDPDKPIEQNKTAWAKAKTDAKIKGRARWHDLRHTALSNALLAKRLNPAAVSEYAGVSLRTIQKVYLHAKAEDTRDISGALTITEEEPKK